VTDYRASIETLRKEAAAAALIRDQATDEIKREMFDRLSQHLNTLADEIERAFYEDAKVHERQQQSSVPVPQLPTLQRYPTARYVAE
jgi:hypothetical protein